MQVLSYLSVECAILDKEVSVSEQPDRCESSPGQTAVATHQPRAHLPRDRCIATRGGVNSDWYIVTVVGLHSDYDKVLVSVRLVCHYSF